MQVEQFDWLELMSPFDGKFPQDEIGRHMALKYSVIFETAGSQKTYELLLFGSTSSNIWKKFS